MFMVCPSLECRLYSNHKKGYKKFEINIMYKIFIYPSKTPNWATVALAEAELVMVSHFLANHPPSKVVRVLLRPSMTLTSKAQLLVSMVRS